MRILTVCTSWRVFGAETITLKLLEGFRDRGHEQLAATSVWTDGEFSRRLGALGLAEKVMPFGVLVASLSPEHVKWTAVAALHLPSLWRQWRRAVRRFRPDMIVWTSSRQPFLLLPFLDRTPSFLIEFTRVAPTRNMRWLFRQLAGRLTGFVAVSDYMRGHLESLGVPPDKVRVVKSGALFERDRRAIEELLAKLPPVSGRLPRVGIVGQIAAHKGHDCLVDAMRLLKERGVKASVMVFGGGEEGYVRGLKRRIGAAGLTEWWQWAGYERDRARIYEQMDVCVVPSCFGDPFPTVAMEAGAYGLPVVATRDGGLPEIVEDGVTGWLVAINSAAELADRLEQLIRHPDRARAMGAAGRERVFKHFTVEKMVAEFELMFSESVGRLK